jgi:hypothetical protein
MSILDCLSRLNPSPFLAVNAANGIPGVPDVTQSNALAAIFGDRLSLIMNGVPLGILSFCVILIGLGVALALINFSIKPQQESSMVAMGDWIVRYSDLIRSLRHVAVVLAVITIGILLCSSVANRYHLWEQNTFPRAAATAAQIVQISPQVRYTIKEPYNYSQNVNGKVTKVRDEKDLTRLLPVNSSNIKVNINKSKVRSAEKWVYTTNFLGEYEVRNITPGSVDFLLAMAPPTGAYIVQSYSVEQDGRRISANSAGEYEYRIQIAPNGTTQLKTSYQAQGAPRWLYATKGELLSKFQLAIESNFNNINSASGLMPSSIEKRNPGKTFTWNLPDNAAIPYAIGASAPNALPAQVGVIPKVILFAPAIWLWWLVMLYLSVPMRIKDILISAGVAGTSILTLAYVMRLFKTEITAVYATPELVWPVIAILLLASAWGLGKNFRTSLAAVICTIAGIILPVLALLTAYQGSILSLAALLSVMWLVVMNWYGWYKLEATIPKIVVTQQEMLEPEQVQEEEEMEKEPEIEFFNNGDDDGSQTSFLKLDPATGDYVEQNVPHRELKESKRNILIT